MDGGSIRESGMGWKLFGEMDQFGQCLPHLIHDEDFVIGIDMGIEDFYRRTFHDGPV